MKKILTLVLFLVFLTGCNFSENKNTSVESHNESVGWSFTTTEE